MHVPFKRYGKVKFKKGQTPRSRPQSNIMVVIERSVRENAHEILKPKQMPLIAYPT
jgi:hypothetical protein